MSKTLKYFMEKFFTVGEAARITGLTAETLRHYDREGILSTRRNTDNGYRRYGSDDIIVLRTVGLLRDMDIPLSAIKRLIDSENLTEITRMLAEAKDAAMRKIDSLRRATEQISRAEKEYVSRLATQSAEERMRIFTRRIAERVVFVSPRADLPSVSNLWQYHGFFKADIDEDRKGKFVFEDTAAVLFDKRTGEGHMFAVCSEYPYGSVSVTHLPSGEWICCNCRVEDAAEALVLLEREASNRGESILRYVAAIRITGLLKWEYELQAFTGSRA